MSDSGLAVARPPAARGWLREARWLHGERARGYAAVFLFATVLVAVLRLLVAGSGVPLLGTAIRDDLVSFWAAGRLALAGTPQSAYNVAPHWAMQRTVYPDFGYEAFYYPPTFLLLCVPLALLPFYVSVAGFISVTLLGYWRVLTRMLPGGTVALLGFPAVAMNLIYGQNAFLTTALFGGALLTLQRRPLLAGLCFGCLCYKPQFGVAVPLALLAARQFRAFAAAAVTVLTLVGASILAFGPATWRAFFAGTALARRTLEMGLVDNAPWVSTFRAVVQAGGGLGAAYLIQGAVSLGVLAAMTLACRRRPAAIDGLLPLAALLTTPFLLVYDLTLLAIPMAWMVARAQRGGFLPWERAALGFAYVVPLAAPFAGKLGIPLAPPAMLALFALALHRAWTQPEA